MSNVKEQHYHVVEMRILTVCSLGVFYKLFMADTREEQHQTMVVASAFIFIAREADCAADCSMGREELEWVWFRSRVEREGPGWVGFGSSVGIWIGIVWF